MQISQQKKSFYMRKELNLHRVFWNTYMPAGFFVLYPNIAAVTSCENDLFGGNKNLSTAVANPGRGTTPPPSPTSYHTCQT